MYAQTVRFPVVPDDAWIRATCAGGTAVQPRGYSARRSAFVVNGSAGRSATPRTESGLIPCSSRRRRKNAEPA